MVAHQEDQCNGSGVGGGAIFSRPTNNNHNKRSKLKKVPQRGLGVAQLERIRIEEQKQKDGSILLSSPQSSSPPSSTTTTATTTSPLGSSSLSITNLPIQKTDFSSLNSLPNSILSDINHNNIMPISHTHTHIRLTNHHSTTVTPWLWSSIAGHENVSKLWKNSCEFNCENQNPRIDWGSGFRSNLELPFELNPTWPSPGLMQRVQQYNQTPPSLVNVSSASSSTSSSCALHYRVEPPSNQKFNNGNYAPIWPEEDKVVGIKRPYPFSLDNPSASLYNYKFPSSIVHHPISRRSDESSVSCVNGNSFNCELRNTVFRENSPVCSASTSRKSKTENRIPNGEDFLSLAPPTSTKNAGLKLKDLSSNQAYNNGLHKFDSLPSYQAYMEDSPLARGGLNHSQQQQQQLYYSFIPPSMADIGQPKVTMNNYNGGREVGENVDLNLKL